MSKILKLKVENIKRIKAVEIVAQGKNFVEITGRNAQGKTSVMDSIAYALGGAKLCPAKPVRDGETFANIELELEDVTIRRLFFADGTSKLSVMSKEGFERKSPQEYLNKIIGTLSFDPLMFTTLEKAKRVALFKKLSGIDTSVLDAEYTKLYDERRQANAFLKKAQAEFDTVSMFSEPVEVPNISELQAKLTHAISNNNARLALVQARDQKRAQIENLRKQLEALIADEINIGQRLSQSSDIDTAEITNELNNVQQAATAAQNHQHYLRTKKSLDESEQLANELQSKIDKNLEAARELLLSKKLPVNGLELKDNDLHFNNIPFDQLSQAEKLKVAVSMAMAENPELKIIRIMDGSLLDNDSMQVLRELSEINDHPIWIETVSNSKPENDAIYIEDGEVA